MLRVRDIMMPAIYKVGADASFEEVAWGLTRLHLEDAPVRDANPGPRPWRHGELTARDLVGPNVPTLFTEDPALYAAHFFDTQDLRRAAVFDEDGCLAGIVTPMDIVRALANGQSFELDMEEEEARSAGARSERYALLM